MKVLKVIGLVALFVIATVLILGVFLKKSYSVVRSVEIDRQKNEVYDYLKLLKNQDRFSVWAKTDPNMKKGYTGTDGTVGFVSSWDSNNKEVGKGEQEIKQMISGEQIDYELRFIRPFESTSNASLKLNATDSLRTSVAWTFNGQMKYPTNVMLLFMDMEKMIGADLEQGLVNLKKILETKH